MVLGSQPASAVEGFWSGESLVAMMASTVGHLDQPILRLWRRHPATVAETAAISQVSCCGSGTR